MRAFVREGLSSRKLKTSKIFEIASDILYQELTPRNREIVEACAASNADLQELLVLKPKQYADELDADVHTLTWSFITWYMVWADLLAFFRIDVSFLANKGTLVKWARDYMSGSPTPRALFEMLAHWDNTLCSVQEREYLFTFGFLVGGLSLPGSAKLGRLLMSGTLSWAPEQLTTINKDGDTVNCCYSLIRSFLLWFSHIGVKSMADDAAEKWLATQQLIKEQPIPEQLLQELAQVAKRHWPKSGSTDHLTGLENRISFGSKADRSGLRGEPMLTCSITATVSKKFLREAARWGLRYPGSMRFVETEEETPSVLLTVPKSYKTDRVIIKEPIHKNWLQHTTRHVVERFVSRCWSYTILPGKPDFNRVAVRDLRYATIDLSSASDLVRPEHVRACFPKEYVRLLAAARSDLVKLPDGSLFSLRSQSGMGNGHTFPVECHVFRCIVEWARWKYHLKWPQNMRSLPVNHVCVNGDDIIVPAKWYRFVIHALELFGFLVNQDKSWSGPYCFRESCGVDVYNGHICTPTRLSRRFRSTAKAVSEVAIDGLPLDDCEKESYLGLVDLGVNLLLTDHMDITRRLVYDICRRAGARFSSEFQVVPADNAVEDHAVFAFSALYSPTGSPDVTASFDVKSPLMDDPRCSSRVIEGRTYTLCNETWGDEALYQWALASPPRDLVSRGRDFFDDEGVLHKVQPIYLGITYTDYPWVSDGTYRTRYTISIRRDFAARLRIARKAKRKVTGSTIKCRSF